jgi:hypothetical protein
MIRKSKSLVIIAISCLISISLLLQSCEKDEFDYALEVPEDYEETGKLHNQGLDFIFEEIKKESIALMQEKEFTSLKSTRTLDYKAIVVGATRSFCESSTKLASHAQTYEKSINLASKRFNSISLKSASLDQSNISNLNDTQNRLIKMIIDEIGNKYKKGQLGKLKKALEEINQMAKDELPEEEASVIYCASSTAYSSYQYWMRNYKKWYFAINYPEIIEKYKEEELNNLQLKNGNLTLKSASSSNDWFNDTWNSVENWWNETTDDVSDWWDENGEAVVIGDIVGAGIGAAHGAYTGAVAGATTGLVFGPGGVVLGGGGGAIGGAVVGAVTEGAMGSAAAVVGTFIDLW